MADVASDPGFPRRAVVGLALGFAAATLVWNLVPLGPADVLPQLAAVPKTPAIDWPAERVDGEFRVVAVGLSPTAGYPYAPLGAVSFATLCQAGLVAARDPGAAPVRIAPLAMDSADAPTVVELCRQAVALGPDVLLVELGANEIASRIIGEAPLIADGWLGHVADRSTRARLVLDAWFRRPPTSADIAEGSPLQSFVARIFEARPGEPLIDGLPVSAADVDAIATRTAKAVDAIAAIAAQTYVEVWLWPSPYDLAGTWPLGMVAVDPLVDRAVLGFRGGGELGDDDRAALAARSERADVQHLLGRLAAAAGDRAAATLHFERARDADPAPWHVVGPVIRALEAAGSVEYRRGVFDVRFVGEKLRPESGDLQRPFVDGQHPDVDGQRNLARALRALLAAHGVDVGDDAAFEAGVEDYLQRVLPDRLRQICEGRGARVDVLTHMIFGAMRDALPRLPVALGGMALEVTGPDDPNWQQWALIAALAAAGAAGDIDALTAGTPAEQAARLATISRELWELDAAGRAAWLRARAARR